MSLKKDGFIKVLSCIVRHQKVAFPTELHDLVWKYLYEPDVELRFWMETKNMFEPRLLLFQKISNTKKVKKLVFEKQLYLRS